jgi:IS30 family transposase
MGNPCSTTLKEALPHWLPYDLDCDEEMKKKLLEMGSSTIERHLQPWKKKHVKGKSATTPPKMKVQIPLELLRDDQRESIGYFEADTVAHCGESLAGQFAWSLTMTDICSGWTENRASFSKCAEAVKKLVKDIESCLPFKILGVASDNGSEFMNEDV